MVWHNVLDYSTDPPRGSFNSYKHDSDVNHSENATITRGPIHHWVFVGHLPYDGITVEDLKTITIQCEDFEKSQHYSVLPPGNIDLGVVHLR